MAEDEEMTPQVCCTISGCEWSCDGVREQPEIMDDVIAYYRTQDPNAFAAGWTFQEAVRIEAEISEHLKGHTMLEALQTIATLKAALKATDHLLQREQQRTCSRICCATKS